MYARTNFTFAILDHYLNLALHYLVSQIQLYILTYPLTSNAINFQISEIKKFS